MKKTKKNAQSVQAQKQKNGSSETVSQEQPQETVAPSLPFDLSTIDPAKIQLAEEMGIPVRALLGWVMSVEERFGLIAENFEKAPQKMVEALRQEALRTREARQQQPPQARTGGSGVSLVDVLKVLREDSSQNPIVTRMMERMMDKSMMGMDLSNALTKAMIIKLAPELASTLTEEITKKG